MLNVKNHSLFHRASIATAGAVAALGLVAAAHAANQTGPYLAGYYGGYKSRGGDFEDENDLYEISAGYRFLPFFGLEVGYTDLGEFGNDVASAELDGYSVSGVGFLPITESFTLYGEVGQFFSTVDVEVLSIDDSYDNETPFYGLGVSFRVTEPLWISAEYQRYKVDVDDDDWPVELDDEETDIDTLKIGAKFVF